MNDLQIKNLKACPEFIPLIAQWFVDEWQYHSVEFQVKRLEACRTSKTYPLTLVGFLDGKVVATAQIILDDMEDRPELTPWFASLLVLPEYRRRGIGRRMIQAAIRCQEEYRIEKLYLFTEDQQELYRSFGWKNLEEAVYHGDQVTVMVRES